MIRSFTVCLTVATFLAATVRAADPPPTHKPSQKWALLIGVNDYSFITKLKYCGVDMEALRSQLIESGFAEKQIRVMTDSAKDRKYLPGKINIETQIDLITSLVDEGDVLVLAFSGHGVSLEGKSYVCPEDAKLDDFKTTMVSVDSVYERLQKCKASLKIVLVDACRDDPTPGGKKGLKDIADDNRKFARPLEKVPEGIVLLNSCSPGESSMEDSKLSHGVFTHFLLKGLQGAADENSDGIVTLSELAAYTGSETKNYVSDKWAYLQRPYLKGELSVDAMRFDFGHIDKKQLEKSITNSIGMKLQLIPAGEFLMGNEESVDSLLKEFSYAKKGWFSDAERRHTVKIAKPFYLGAAAVTHGQFAQFVKAEGYKTEAEKDGKGGWGYDAAEKTSVLKPEFNWRNTGFTQTDNHPVVNISWNDAQAFIDWLSKKEGKKYRLPTEAEWEYACRAGTTTRYIHGDDPEALVKAANTWDAGVKAKFPNLVNQLKGNDGYVFTSPVDVFRPNAFSLYDMNGNVLNWCSDWYDADYYANSPASDPQGPTTGSSRVLRGGGWRNYAAYCRSANRIFDDPSYRSGNLGFRLALVPSS